MAVYDVKLTDQSTTVQNPDASSRLGFGDIDGPSFSFGGINDRAPIWPWFVGLGAVGLFVYWFFIRKRT